MSNQPRKHLDRKDELNIARFAIISIQSRVNSDQVKWELVYKIEDRDFNIIAYTPEGRPHGIDSDVFSAVQTIFYQQGCPDHNWVHTSMYEVRELAGLHDNGTSYERIRESLKRLFTTSFVVEEGWHDYNDNSRRWNSDTLRFFDRVKHQDPTSEVDEEIPGLKEGTTLSIKISDQVARSIRAKFTLTLDGKTLEQLEQPPSRSLLRLLEAHRTQPDGTRLSRLTISMQQWQVATGIMSDRGDMARRVLGSAHEELLASNYIRDVVYHGRGKDQVIEYVFQPDDAPDHALVKLLEVHGLAPAIAAKMAREHPDRIEEALAFVKERKASRAQVKNQAGLIVDYLKNPDKYSKPEKEVPKAEVGRGEQKQLAASIKKQEELAATELKAEHHRLLALPPEQQYRECESFFNLILGKLLSKHEQERLKEACQAGALLAVEVKEGLVQATARNKRAEFVAELKQSLNNMPGPLFS